MVTCDYKVNHCARHSSNQTQEWLLAKHVISKYVKVINGYILPVEELIGIMMARDAL